MNKTERTRSAEDISAHHLQQLRKEVESVIELCLGHWASLSDVNRHKSLPDFIDAVMSRIAPQMLAACTQAVDVDRPELLLKRWYAEVDYDGNGDWCAYNAQQFARRADADALVAMLDGKARLIRVEHSVELD